MLLRHPAVKSEQNMYRKNVNKHQSANKFRNQTRKTKSANLQGAPMRGGIRL